MRPVLLARRDEPGPQIVATSTPARSGVDAKPELLEIRLHRVARVRLVDGVHRPRRHDQVVDVTVSAFSQSRVARWNGTAFAIEDNNVWYSTPTLFKPPGSKMMAGGSRGIVQHQ